jgi:hypothetical protein
VRLLLLALLGAMAVDAAACTCVMAEPKTAFKRSATVFFGEVLSYDGAVARIRVVEGFKEAKGTIEVFTGSDGAACGYGGALTAGSRHLIYANRVNGRLETNVCTRTKPESGAACDLRYLRSRAVWWRSPLSSLRMLERLGVRREACPSQEAAPHRGRPAAAGRTKAVALPPHS